MGITQGVPSSGGGIHFIDPRFMYRSYVFATGLWVVTHNGSSTIASTTASFFTELANRGTADNTTWTANTYKTIVNVTSSAGLVSHLLGPTGLAGTPTTTFEITVDGSLREIPVVASASGYRASLGPLSQGVGGSNNVFFTTAGAPQAGPDSRTADQTTDQLSVNGGSVVEPIPFASLSLLGTPLLQFNNSLLVRMKSSENNSTTTNNEQQSAVSYRIL